MATAMIVWLYMAGMVPTAWAMMDMEGDNPIEGWRLKTVVVVVGWPITVPLALGEALVDVIVRRIP